MCWLGQIRVSAPGCNISQDRLRGTGVCSGFVEPTQVLFGLRQIQYIGWVGLGKFSRFAKSTQDLRLAAGINSAREVYCCFGHTTRLS